MDVAPDARRVPGYEGHSGYPQAPSQYGLPGGPRPPTGGYQQGQQQSYYQNHRSSNSPNTSISSFNSTGGSGLTLTDPRTSSDQSSIHSSAGGSYRNSIFANFDDIPKPGTYNLNGLLPQNSQHQPMGPPPSSSHSNYSFSGVSDRGIKGHHHSRHDRPQDPGDSAKFHLDKPKDERVIDQMFIDLMNERDFKNLPEQAKRQMQAYPASKKWTLIYQDRLARWQSDERKRAAREKANSMVIGAGVVGVAAGVPGVKWQDAVDEGSPQWYVKKLYSDARGGQPITGQQLGSLAVSLRTQPLL